MFNHAVTRLRRHQVLLPGVAVWPGRCRRPHEAERRLYVSAFRLGRVNLSRVPVNRLNTLARCGQPSKAPTIEQAPEPRKTALLTAVVHRPLANRRRERPRDAHRTPKRAWR
ncbi:hypothetical protein OG373_39900 [Streptomyces avidinii]|uniref:hypothetical protein n=1 Tax=Streptomyces avidinii TaxID=1895 RepID=UPI00386A3018|nr:hypothetical protein OG373_39900 [Streptomyces avidinii]